MSAIDKSRITSARLMFTIVCFIQASSLLTSFMTAVTKQDSWLTVLACIVVYIPFLMVYRAIIVKFSGLNLLQVFELVFGKVVGKFAGLLFVWFFFTLAALNLSDLGDFARETLMEETPKTALIVVCALVSAMAVRGGIRAVAWYSALYMVVTFVILALSILLVLSQFRFENFLPMFDQPFPKYLQGLHIISTIPFGELVAFLMVTPSVDFTKRNVTRSLFLGFFLGALATAVVVVRDTGALGNTMHLFSIPSLVALRMVHLGEALTRMEILFATVLLMLLFVKITFLLYVAVLSFAQLIGAKSYKHLAFISAAFIAAYGQTLYTNQAQHAQSAQQIVPILWTFFEFLIPIIAVFVAAVRKLPREGMA
jgi:spore germination protein KB